MSRKAIGRLGDLGAIDKKYDVAVSTAVGALDYVVVETTADALRAIFAKEQLGRRDFFDFGETGTLGAKVEGKSK